jgi:aminodeoxyfutalosine deaminase
MHSLRVSWLFDGIGPPRPLAAVRWSGERVLEVGIRTASDESLGNPFPPALATALAGSDDLAIVPGFVNGHTHLEFSDVATPLAPAAPFVDWLSSVIRSRRSRTETPIQAIRRGVHESLRAGVTTIADILTTDWPEVAEMLAGERTALPRLFPFREALGLRPDQRDVQLARSREHLEKTSHSQPHLAGTGLSPHAPYSVHSELLTALIELARAKSAPVAMHLAETRDELELLATGRGPFVEFLERLGVWHPPAFPRAMRPLDYLQELAKAPRALVVHGNYLDPEELRFIAERPQMTLVYCPRTQHYFGHTPHPWRTLRELGGRVILGTDSRASNPDLDLFAEARFLAAGHPDVPRAELLAMVTREAAVALCGNEADFGTLAPGQRADLAVIRLPPGGGDPWERLFAPASVVVATLAGGRWATASG